MDVVISYLPEASMGSAVEIHAAMLAGKKILVVAPISRANWVVRSYADLVFKSIDELGSWLKRAWDSNGEGPVHVSRIGSR